MNSIGQPFYFTIKNAKRVGFTDNLGRLRALHKLAVSIGGKYVHSPLVSLRSPANVYGFLGLEEGWKRNISDVEFTYLPKVELELSQVRHKIESIWQLQQLLITKVREAEHSHETKPIMVLSGRGAHSLFPLIHSTLPEDKDELNFVDRYTDARSRNPLGSDFL